MASTSNGIMTNGATKSKSTTVPWVEKYRPTEFEDIMGNETVIERFKVFAECGNIPNVLLCGPPGVGKTTTIHCLARKLLGPQYKDAVLELNASNERGIDVVRNKIKTFAQRKVTLPPGRTKFVVLDEADEMTEGAQQALRRTMECYSSTTRFLLACNLPDKLIEPIQSRCAVVSFSKPSSGQVKERLKTICEDEGVKYDDEGLDAIVFVADGDMRQAINSLQSAHDGFGLVNADNVFKVCDEPHPLMIKEAIQNCMKNNLDEANQVLSHLWKLGYSAEDIITNIFKVVKTMDMPEYLNLEFIKEIGVTYIRISEGNSSLLQFTSLAARLCKKAMKAN